jgi:tyrosine-protein kinase Etk/Wzc
MDEPVNHSSPNGKEVYLLDYLIIMAKHSRMIILTSAGMTVLTFLILFILPNKYTATARLLPPQQNLTLSAQLLDSLGNRVPAGGSPSGGIGSMAASLMGFRTPGDMYVAMMTGDTVLDNIIQRFNLMKVYKTKYFEDARKILRKNARVSIGQKDNIIVIEVTSMDPKLAGEIANNFIEELDGLLQKLALHEAKGRLVFLEKERLQASQDLAKAEESVRLFSEQNSVLQLDTQTRGAIEYIARLRAEIDAKEVGIEVLRQQATPANFDLVRMETEVNGLKEKLRAAEAQKANCLSGVCLPTDKTPTLGLEYLRLIREAKFHEYLYQLYNRLVEVARMDMARDVSVVQVVDPASPPEKRSNKLLMPSVLAGVITFFIMIIVAFGKEHIHSVNNREEGKQRLSMLKDYLRPWKDTLIRIIKYCGSLLSRQRSV